MSETWGSSLHSKPAVPSLSQHLLCLPHLELSPPQHSFSLVFDAEVPPAHIDRVASATCASVQPLILHAHQEAEQADVNDDAPADGTLLHLQYLEKVLWAGGGAGDSHSAGDVGDLEREEMSGKMD